MNVAAAIKGLRLKLKNLEEEHGKISAAILALENVGPNRPRGDNHWMRKPENRERVLARVQQLQAAQNLKTAERIMIVAEGGGFQ